MNPWWIIAGIAAGAVALAKLFKSEPNPASVVEPLTQPRAFISFDYDHNLGDKNLFAGQLSKRSPTPFSAQDWSSKEPLPQKEWEELIHEKIGRCHVMFVLVSPTCHAAKGVEKEIAMALAQNVPFVGVYIAGADERTTLPKGLARDRVYVWRWELLSRSIARMLTEGKNAKRPH